MNKEKKHHRAFHNLLVVNELGYKQLRQSSYNVHNASGGEVVP